MIGEMKHRVTLQQPINSADSGGGFTTVWEDLATNATVYAAILPLSGTEQLQFHQRETAVTHRIVMRYRTDVTGTMRILKGSTVYNILSVIDQDGKGAYLEILARVNQT